MNKLSKDKRDKLILICIGIAAIIGGLYTFVFGSQQNTIATLQNKITGVKSKVHKAEILVKSAEVISTNLAEGRVAISAREESMAPQGQYYYWFLKLIDQFRKDEKLDTGFITDITQPEFIEAGLQPNFPYKAASFGLRLNGRFHDVGRFIAAVENTFPYFRVEDVRIAPAGTILSSMTKPTVAAVPTESSEDKLTVELKIVTLIRPGNS